MDTTELDDIKLTLNAVILKVEAIQTILVSKGTMTANEVEEEMLELKALGEDRS